jgi:CheY-like chemotaxis protein
MKDNKYAVLIVDDEPALLDSYAEIIEGEKYTVLKAPDGYKGLEVLAANRDIVDIILLDLMMPGIDGLEVLKNIRQDPAKYGSMPVMVLTNLSSERVIKEAFERGASGYLMKTEIEPEQVLTEIGAVIAAKKSS